MSTTIRTAVGPHTGRTRPGALGAALGLALAGLLAATPAMPQSTAEDHAVVAPVPHTENGITTLCGGVGAEEAAHMKREAEHFNLMLTFAERDGSYIADVGIGIADADGTPMLHTTCGAPILLVNFSRPGSYQVTAEVGGQSVSRMVHITRAKGGIMALARPVARGG